MFDGVHLGHVRVISSAVDAARQADGVSLVLTFPDHPSRLLRPESPTPLILAPETKTARLLDLEVEHVVLQPFDESFAKLRAEDFAAYLQTAVPALQGIHVGENFQFGRGRSGDVALLAETAATFGIEVAVSPPVERQGVPISSSRIREALVKGEIVEVNEMLGRCYEASGIVETGAGRGVDLGFPTLNLPWAPGVEPLYGVYAVELIAGEDKRRRPGVANYGVRPTFDEDCGDPVLETHLFENPEINLGDCIRVAFRAFLREEKKFDSVKSLAEQIGKDKELAREALST